MATVAELRHLLYGTGDRPRAGAPEPTLLVWLAALLARLPESGPVPSLRQEVRIFGLFEGQHREPWPVIGDAVTELLGDPQRFLHRHWALLGDGSVTDPAVRRLRDHQVAYLLPTLPPATAAAVTDRAVAAVREALRRGTGWYATALTARVARFLDDDQRDELAGRAIGLDPVWRDRFRELTARPQQWPTAAGELLSTHPAVPDLDRTADATGVAELLEVVRSVVPDIGAAGRLGGPYRPTGDRSRPVTSSRPVARPPDSGIAPTTGAPVEWGSPPPDLDDLPPDVDELGEARSSGWLAHSAGPVFSSANEVFRLGRRSSASRARYVNTGVAAPQTPDRPLGRSTRLAPGTPYVFWLEIGRPVPGAIERRPQPLALPAGAGPGTVVTVALFGFPGEIAVEPGADVGELVVAPDGSLAVRRQPGGGSGFGRRLDFPVRTPAVAGRHRLRCGIYCRGILLQSRLVTLEVGTAGPPRPHRSELDYAVDTRLDPAELRQLRPLDLSVFINDNGDGTHGFRFFGDGGAVKQDASLDAYLVQDAISRVRQQLRRTCWGRSDEYQESFDFRYAHGRTDPVPDLINLAQVGHALWAAIAGHFAGPYDGGLHPMRRLAERMRRPGVVEIASKASSRMVVPAALFYDHPLRPQPGLAFCPTARAALRAGADLAGQPCFQGACPAYGDESVVCPAGFWGFRHELGLPHSALPVAPGTVEVTDVGGGQVITCDARPRCLVGIAQEFAGTHVEWVSGLGGAGSRPHQDPAALLAALRTPEPPAPQIVYFFCHGAVVDGVPLLRVGPRGTAPITSDVVGDGRVFWPQGRPLIFLNGCRTAAVEPRYAMSFVDAFLRTAHASGVVGTEIVTYEALAAEFGRMTLDGFVNRRETLGAAIRSTRLALLAAGNPLGLIYVAYAPPNLRLGPS